MHLNQHFVRWNLRQKNCILALRWNGSVFFCARAKNCRKNEIKLHDVYVQNWYCFPWIKNNCNHKKHTEILCIESFKPLLHEMGSWTETHRARLDKCYWGSVNVRKGGWGVSQRAFLRCHFLMSYQTCPACPESLRVPSFCAWIARTGILTGCVSVFVFHVPLPLG